MPLIVCEHFNINELDDYKIFLKYRKADFILHN
jgi:hypothetical protein